LHTLLTAGDLRQDRTGVGTLAVFGHTLHFDLAEGFPVFTTKRISGKPPLGDAMDAVRRA